MELIESTQALDKVKQLEQQLQSFLSLANELPTVKEIRVLGAIGVIETHRKINVAEAQKRLVAKGVWVRPFKNLLYIMPPYSMNTQDLNQLCEAMIEVVQLDEIYNK